jgi:hypothetical protein
MAVERLEDQIGLVIAKVVMRMGLEPAAVPTIPADDAPDGQGGGRRPRSA